MGVADPLRRNESVPNSVACGPLAPNSAATSDVPADTAARAFTTALAAHAALDSGRRQPACTAVALAIVPINPAAFRGFAFSAKRNAPVAKAGTPLQGETSRTRSQDKTTTGTQAQGKTKDSPTEGPTRKPEHPATTAVAMAAMEFVAVMRLAPRRNKSEPDWAVSNLIRGGGKEAAHHIDIETVTFVCGPLIV
jgi:hypothetical protein